MRIGTNSSLLVALALLPLTLSGCGNPGGDSGSPTTPSGPPSAGSAIVYSAVGASDVIGFGSSKPCLPFQDCDGNGYVWVAARQLRSQRFTVEISQLGIPAGVISPTFQDLATQIGRNDVLGNFIQQELPFVRRDATLVTVFAGANDVRMIAGGVDRGLGGSNPAGYVDSMVAAFASDFATLISGIRDRTKSARIIVLNVPNIAGLPSAAGSPLASKQFAQRAAVRITTTVINPYAGITVIDLMCDPRLYQPAYLYSDGFHPNDAGYAALAAEVVSALTSTSYPAPKSSCAQMTLF